MIRLSQGSASAIAAARLPFGKKGVPYSVSVAERR